MTRQLAPVELELTYAARRPWAPRRAQFTRWARAALAAVGKPEPRGGAAQDGEGRHGTARDGAGRRSAARAPGRWGTARAPGRWVVSIRVVGAARSRTLNARYRRKDRPTNVLSFAGPGAFPDGRCFLGELIICAPVVAREARAQGKSAEAQWAHMTVHGILHLLGFDHELGAEARKMTAKEVQILDQLGFSDPYV